MYKIPFSKPPAEFSKVELFAQKLRKFFANQNNLLFQAFDEREGTFVHFMFEPIIGGGGDGGGGGGGDNSHNGGCIKIYQTEVTPCDDCTTLKIDIGNWSLDYCCLSDQDVVRWIKNLFREHKFDLYDLFPNDFVCNQDFALIYARKDLHLSETIDDICAIKETMLKKYTTVDQIINNNKSIIKINELDFIVSTLKNCTIDTLNMLQTSERTPFILSNLVVNYYKHPKFITDPITMSDLPIVKGKLRRNKCGDLYMLNEIKICDIQTKFVPNFLLKEFQEQSQLSPYFGECFGCGSEGGKLNLKYLCFSCWKKLLGLYLDKTNQTRVSLCEFNSYNQTLKFEPQIKIKLDSNVNVLRVDG